MNTINEVYQALAEGKKLRNAASMGRGEYIKLDTERGELVNQDGNPPTMIITQSPIDIHEWEVYDPTTPAEAFDWCPTCGEDLDYRTLDRIRNDYQDLIDDADEDEAALMEAQPDWVELNKVLNKLDCHADLIHEYNMYDRIRSFYEGGLSELPEAIANNIDWDAVVQDSLSSYTPYELQGTTYYAQ